MYKFVQRINEIKYVLTRFRIIETALDSMIVFLISFLIFPHLGIRSGWLLPVPSLAYAAIRLRTRFNGNIVNKIEEFYPSLKERLSTVYDNKEEDNIVVEDLASSVLTDMEQVRYSSFISTKRLGIRVAITLLLVTLILSSPFNSPTSEGTKDSTSDTKLSSAVGINNFTGGSDADILNESSFIRIGNDKQELMIYRGTVSELNVRGEREQVPRYTRLFPEEEQATVPSSGAYSESIPPVYQQIVKNYFTNLTSQE